MSKKRKIFIGIIFAFFLGIVATFGIIRHQLGTPPDCRIDEQGRVMTIRISSNSFWHRVFLVSPPGGCAPPKDYDF